MVPDHWLGLGRVLELQGEIASAERLYAEAVQMYPLHTGLLGAWGASLYTLNENERAIPLLEQAFADYVRIGNNTAAEQILTLQVGARRRLGRQRMAAGDVEGACAILDQGQGQIDSYTASEAIDQVTCARVGGNIPLGIMILETVLPREPDRADIVLLYAELLRESNRLPDAILVLSTFAERIRFERADVVVALASAQVVADAPEAALETLRRGMTARTQVPIEFITTQAAALERQGDLNVSRDLWKQAYMAAPDQLRLGLELARLHSALGETEPLFVSAR